MTSSLNDFVLVKPEGRRKLWSVHGYRRGRLVATWTCDGEAIARELLRRLKAGKPPGWVARDLRRAE